MSEETKTESVSVSVALSEVNLKEKSKKSDSAPPAPKVSHSTPPSLSLSHSPYLVAILILIISFVSHLHEEIICEGLRLMFKRNGMRGKSLSRIELLMRMAIHAPNFLSPSPTPI